MDKNTFLDFLDHAFNQKELPLIVFSEEHEKSELEEIIKDKGFIDANNRERLLDGIEKGGLYYLNISIDSPEDFKETYDIIVQYPMNQIQALNKENMEKRIINVDYYSTSVVLFISGDILQEFQKQGFNLLSKVGITYQANN